MVDYWTGETQVLAAGRAVQNAVALNDSARLQVALRHLTEVGEAREATAGTVAGFRTDETLEDTAAWDPDEELERVLAELEIGTTFMAASALTEPEAQIGPTDFHRAIVELEATHQRRRATVAQRAGFGPEAGDHAVDLQQFRESVTSFLDDVVARTTSLGTRAIAGLAAIPLAAVQPWLTTAGSLLDELPLVGRLAQLGLRAVRRAVNALQKWVPKSLRSKARELAASWWDDKGHTDVTARLLGVESLRQEAAAAIHDDVEQARVEIAAASLDVLSARHLKATESLNKVVRSINHFTGPLAQVFPAAIGWLYAAAAAGLVGAMGAALWVSRDVFDTGSLWEHTDGMRAILAGLST